jgi:hypothetical protein
MSWVSRATCVAALGAIVASIACGSFGKESPGGSAADAGVASEAGATCASETCADAGPSCFFDDFGGACPAVTFSSGDKGKPGVVGECSGGKLRVAADGTLDMTAHVSHDTPDLYDSIRVSMLLAVAAWDLGPVLSLTLDGAQVAELDFAQTKLGPSFTLCAVSATDCAAESFAAKDGEVHRFTFDIKSGSVALSVDCKPIATRPLDVKLGPRATVAMVFGKNDANAIDATLDELGISFP